MLRYSAVGPLAQLVELRTFNPQVVGSSPTGPTNVMSRNMLDSMFRDIFFGFHWGDGLPVGWPSGVGVRKYRVERPPFLDDLGK